ncbi:MAG: bifunctional oligoribonuclease/PAP phosphatase NrnA [Bacteroidia bacterium]|nr:bifunctional oligoribonuclease/PAP phosphatase NrnA [Bacteroidia bacterium]
MEQAAILLAELKQAGENVKIVITTHHKPDGDAMGSSLGLHLFLKAAGIPSQVLTPTDYPAFLSWMKGNESVIIYEGNEVVGNKLIAEANYIFCLDFNNLSRINEMGERVKESTAKLILVDHHQLPQKFEHLSFWDPKASSTCELIFRLIDKSGLKNLMNKEIASCLYTGIMTDTGSFKFSNCTAETHKIAAELISLGVDHVDIQERLFDSFTENRVRFIGYALSKKLEIMRSYNTALITITSDELKEYESQTGDTEGLVNFGLGVNGIRLAVLIIDRGKLVKMSFRSKGTFNVNEFARLHFNGGGHINAAGGSSTETLEETVARFKKVLPLHIKELTS